MGAAALVAAATGAYFTDSETSTGNTFAAGTLDLVAGGGSSTMPITFSNKAPGDSDVSKYELTNGGSLGGLLDVKVTSVTNTGATGRTPAVTCEYCDASGDLGGAVAVAYWLDLNNDGVKDATDIGLKSDETTYDPSTALQYDTLDNYSGKKWNDTKSGNMASGDKYTLMVDYGIPTTAGNGIQGDLAEIVMDFQLRQSGASGF